MIISEKDRVIILQDTLSQQPDTSTKEPIIKDSFAVRNTVSSERIIIPQEKQEPDLSDSTTVYLRNSIADVTLYDTASVINNIEMSYPNRFPFLFMEKNKDLENKARLTLEPHLKSGKEIPEKLFHDDWIILIVLISVSIYAVISVYPGKLIREVKNFFIFRNIGNASSFEIGELFHWQSTLFNLVSFFNLALFSYCATIYYKIASSSISGFIFWLILLMIVISAITLRHILCHLTGKISGESNAFNEYTITIYLFYRNLAVILFILTILLCYTTFLPAKSLIIVGFITIVILYLVRLIKLFFIFINRNISIFYLILYLCALEFLPVAVLIKYFTGLF
jgi:hypothetical protein